MGPDPKQDLASYRDIYLSHNGLSASMRSAISLSSYGLSDFTLQLECDS